MVPNPQYPANNGTPPLFFFYASNRIMAPSRSMTGAAIKELIRGQVPDFDLTYSLVLEGHGGDADVLIADDAVLDLTHGHGDAPKHFGSKPPTSFGDQRPNICALEEHFARLRELYPEATMTAAPESAMRIHIPAFPLPPGWSQSETQVWFVVPAGYPGANPDCFWAEAELHLANGGAPRNTSVQLLPGTSTQTLWFSWHVVRGWNPVTHDLRTYVAMIAARFQEVS